MKESAYCKAGVDIEAGEALVERIKPLARATNRPGTMGGLGGFGAFFDLKPLGLTDPVLVAATDGVGTKLKIAIETGFHDTVGIDLVAMCVNDLVVQGAEPLFFLDYFASGKLSVDHAAQVVAGIAKGCEIAGCALIGGETAEMPGMYAPGDYDLAGFAVGAVERAAMLTGEKVREGDTALGLASSGVHSNGFSLVRRVAQERGLSWDAPAPWEPSARLGEALLTPTRIYVKPLLEALKAFEIRALAHITGGGLLENIPRVLPEGLGVRLDAEAWEFPPAMRWLKSAAGMEDSDVARTFNCGIGMVAIAPPEEARELAAFLTSRGERVFTIGVVERAQEDAPRVRIEGMEGWNG